MIDFSLIMPVRNNIPGLKTCLGAFQLFTAKPDRFEIHLLVDDNDLDAEEYFELIANYKLQIFIHIVKPTDNFCNEYYNWALQHCRGKNIMVWNDDCYVQTMGWDELVRYKISINSHFKGVYLVDMMDSTRRSPDGSEFPRFPIISRKAVDLLGFFFYPQVRIWPADKVIWDLYSKVGCVITCHDVKLQHDHNFNHSVDPSKSRMYRVLQEDINNGVFPVNADTEFSKLHYAITGKWPLRPDGTPSDCNHRGI